tara:strand:- start:752 stop:1033 length:282 start_codon:yes stop_codon:yes gene_type:complete
MVDAILSVLFLRWRIEMNSRKDLYHLLLLVNQKADKIADRLEMVEKQCNILQRSFDGHIGNKEFDTLKAQHLNLLNAFVEHVPDYTDDPQPKE